VAILIRGAVVVVAALSFVWFFKITVLFCLTMVPRAREAGEALKSNGS
jgi:hypothetical protein